MVKTAFEEDPGQITAHKREASTIEREDCNEIAQWDGRSQRSGSYLACDSEATHQQEEGWIFNRLKPAEEDSSSPLPEHHRGRSCHFKRMTDGTIPSRGVSPWSPERWKTTGEIHACDKAGQEELS